MTIENIELVNTLVFIMIGLFVINSLFVMAAMYAVTRQVANAQKAFTAIHKQTLDRLEDIRMILAKTYAVQKKIPEIEGVLMTQLDGINHRAVQANDFLKSHLIKFSQGVDDANRRMDITLNNYSRFASQLDTLVRVPVINFKSLCSGMSAGIRELSHKERSISEIPNDEEFFI